MHTFVQQMKFLGIQSRSILHQSKYFYHIHEYMAMGLLQKYDIPVPAYGVAASADEAYKVACELGRRDNSNGLVVKAQVLAGGRSKGSWDSGLAGGGVQLVSTPDEARSVSAGMLGHRLRTRQTGEEGRPCHRVLVCERWLPRLECYFAVVMHGGEGGPAIVASRSGGVNIEEVAKASPDKLHTVGIDPELGLDSSAAAGLAEFLGFSSREQAAEVAQRLYRLFVDTDATQVEINPLVEDESGRVGCLDCKMNLDSNARHRQQQLYSMRDTSQEDQRDVEAQSYGLHYVALHGTVGCLVNGAGLAMATMDIVRLHGGSPANFLDIGGGATASQVAKALGIIASDPQVGAVLINIFGGIVRCDAIANGVVAAVHKMRLHLPIVLRLQGNMMQEAKRIVAESGLSIIACDSLDMAASKVVQLANSVQQARHSSQAAEFELPI